MGILLRKDSSSTQELRTVPVHTMDAPVPTTGKSAVDRLTTFFLGKFQETKKDNSLTELQCMTRLKFEATEKMLKEHEFSIGTLRDEMRSFWDKAPSFFLHQFSAQLDALGSGRSEKSEQSLNRLEQRMDDEVRNLGEQLTDLSTKLAVGNAALNATVDEFGQKIRAVDDTHASALRRSESEIRSKLARLESMLESGKTEADIEREKLHRTTQEANRRLLEKLESLELTLAMRQPEEQIIRQSENQLMLQAQAIARLEQDVHRLTQLVVAQDKAASNMARTLIAQEQALQQAISKPLGIIHAPKRWRSPSPPPPFTTSTSSSPPLGHVGVTPNPATNSAGTIRDRYLASPDMTAPPSSLIPPVEQRKRRYDSQDRQPLRTISQAQNRMGDQEPASKRQRTLEKGSGKCTTQSMLPSTSATRTDRSFESLRREAGSRTQLRQPRTIGAPENTNKVAESHRINAPKRTAGTHSQDIKRMQTKSSPAVPASPAPAPAPDLAPAPVQAPAPLAPPLQKKRNPTQASSQQHGPNDIVKRLKSQNAGLKKNQEEHMHKALDTGVQEKQRDQTMTPETPQNEERRQKSSKSPDSRDSMRAFAMHVKSFASQYNENPPRSERQFIWSFLEGIPDGRWSTYVQSKLLEKYPEAVRPSLGIRAKHTINFDAGLTWRHVVAMLRELTQSRAA